MATNFSTTPLPTISTPIMSTTNSSSEPGTHHIPLQFPPGMIPAVVWSMMPFIIILNAVVIIAFATNKRLRVTANYFVVSLACGDFLVGSVVIPLILTFNPLGNHFTLFCLFNTLTMILGCSYDRYVAVSQPLRYSEIVTKKKVYVIIAACWVCPAILPIIPEIWNKEKLFSRQVPHRTFMGSIAVFVLIAILVQAVVYIRIFLVARRHIRAMQQLDRFSNEQDNNNNNNKRRRGSVNMKKFVREVRFAKLFALIALNFFIFWIPIGYINLVDDTLLRNDLMPPWIFKMSFYTMYLTSLINPILYALFTKVFRQTILKWLSYLPGCRSIQVNAEESFIPTIVARPSLVPGSQL